MGNHNFRAELKIIGINPFVFLPEHILNVIFKDAGKNKSPIPVKGTINKKRYQQTLVKYKGAWRLYINLQMLQNSPQRIGEIIEVDIAFDPSDRTLEIHPKLKNVLDGNPKANEKFNSIPPYLQQEIIRYITNLKTEKSEDRNVERAVQFLLGKGSFVGRKKI